MTEPDLSPWRDGVSAAWVEPAVGRVVLVDGTNFCISATNGDIRPDQPMGFFVLDTRVVSALALRLDGMPIRSLGAASDGPLTAVFVGSHEFDPAGDRRLLMLRRRFLGPTLMERIELTNHGDTAVTVVLRVDVQADFADLFAVKEGRLRPPPVPAEDRDGAIRFCALDGVRQVEIRATPKPDGIDADGAEWSAVLAPGAVWTLALRIRPRLETTTRIAERRDAQLLEEPSAVQWRTWSRNAAMLRSNSPSIDDAFEQSLQDIGALRIVDPEHPHRFVVAAGAPWYMTLFGRDSLLTGWMTLPFAPEIARGVLETLADHQGVVDDPATEEQPGRILHEVRLGGQGQSSFSRGVHYYGTADATPLFVMLVAEAVRWGLDERTVRALLPNVDRCLGWMSRAAAATPHGPWISYRRSTDTGLANQGWRDSWNGIRYADGRVATAPIALADVQAYRFAALRGRADLARRFEDEPTAAVYDEFARRLQEQFVDAFWLEDRGWYAIGLDATGAPIDSLTSTLGHLLWCGIVPDEHQDRLAELLVGSELFSGWGVRTLADTMGGFDPLSYHCGSVWPHDTAVAIAGLTATGHRDAAARLAEGLFDLAAHHGGRLPELIAGLSRSDVPAPIDYPSSCTPQAWAAGAMLLAVRSVLGLEPDAAALTVVADPALPPVLDEVELLGIRIGRRGRVRLRVDGTRVDIRPYPMGLVR